MFGKMFWRSFCLQAVWNFERLQNLGLAYILGPALKKIYPQPEQRRAAILRHLEFFNTHPYMVNLFAGLIAALEEEKARAEDISTIKKNMAGALAAIGDSLFWATWRPLAALIIIVIYIVRQGFIDCECPFGYPLLFLLIYNLPVLSWRWYSLVWSYRQKTALIRRLVNWPIKRIILGLEYFGLLLMLIGILFYLGLTPAAVYRRSNWLFLAGLFLAVVLTRANVPALILFYGALVVSVLLKVVGVV